METTPATPATPATKAKKYKFTKVEARAYYYLQQFRNAKGADEEMYFTMEWRRSRDYGYCPVICNNDGRMAYAGGYGYDKKSACLANFCAFLFHPRDEEDNHYAVRRLGGGGQNSVIQVLDSLGYTLEHVTDTPSTDVYLLHKKDATTA